MTAELMELFAPFILSGAVAGGSAWVAMRVENAVIRSQMESLRDRVHKGKGNLSDAVQTHAGKIAMLEERTKHL